jgi:hypothetical protein
MSKRRSYNSSNNIGNDNEIVNATHKRIRLNEEGDSMQVTERNDDISDIEGCDQHTQDVTWDKLLKIFWKIVTDLHKYNKDNIQNKNISTRAEEKKVDHHVNNDESVRLQQEPEIDENEQKIK